MSRPKDPGLNVTGGDYPKIESPKLFNYQRLFEKRYSCKMVRLDYIFCHCLRGDIGPLLRKIMQSDCELACSSRLHKIIAVSDTFSVLKDLLNASSISESLLVFSTHVFERVGSCEKFENSFLLFFRSLKSYRYMSSNSCKLLQFLRECYSETYSYGNVVLKHMGLCRESGRCRAV